MLQFHFLDTRDTIVSGITVKQTEHYFQYYKNKCKKMNQTDIKVWNTISKLTWQYWKAFLNDRNCVHLEYAFTN